MLGMAIVMLVLCLSAGSMLGAAPKQGGVPPQPFLADYFSGWVLLQGVPAPYGITLVACVDDCRTGFQSQPVMITAGGEYRMLEINPEDRTLRGREIGFYLMNAHGRIRAEQKAIFEGAYNISDLLLVFPDPMPAPPPLPPTPSLPAVGDARVPELPRYALGLGALALLSGLALLLVARQRSV